MCWKGRMYNDVQTLTSVRDELQEWRHRLHTLSASGEISSAAPAELTSITEVIAEHLDRVIGALDQDETDFSDISSHLQQQVNDLRLVSLETTFRRLARPVRDAAQQAGKQVELELRGGDVALNRQATESLYAPLLHLVRNAVAHGIEDPAAREAAGKPRGGVIRVSAAVEPDRVVLTVADDGAGLNFEAIRARAVQRGMIAADAVPDRDALTAAVFQPGFTTEKNVNDLSGRGVGMDVVKAEVEALEGRIEVDSVDGQGLTIRLVFPIKSEHEEYPPLAIERT